MRALCVVAAQKFEFRDFADPPAPGPGQVRLRMRRLSLNHLDLLGWRGMAFMRRRLPLVAGVEGAGQVEAVGVGVHGLREGDRVAVYPAVFCGTCAPCRRGRTNLCEAISGIFGFHVDGLAVEVATLPARVLVPMPDGASWNDGACAGITLATVQHMLVENAELSAGETVLVQAGCSGIGSTAISVARARGARVIATVGSDWKVPLCGALGAHEVLQYGSSRFDRAVLELTGGRGVDVVFEHVGSATWPSSLRSLARGGRLVTCGSTSGLSGRINLYQLFNRQLRLIGSFGGRLESARDGLHAVAQGFARIAVDDEIPLADFEAGLRRMAARRVVGKILVRVPE